MVTFSCEVCNESMLKKKADQHTQRCYGAYFTCIDCSTTFNGDEYRQHTQCITEDQKYQKALYKPKKNQQKAAQNAKPKPQVKETKIEKETKPAKEVKTDSKVSKRSSVDLKEHKGKGLYKVLKNLSKDEKKDLLKRIVDGSLQLQ